MIGEEKIKKERRVYFFHCDKCGKLRQSYRRRRARNGVCRPCRKAYVDENQMTLFSSFETKEKEVCLANTAQNA